MTAVEAPTLTNFDPTDPDILRQRMPHEELLALRQTAPVSWIEQADPGARAGFLDTGYWALSKHADVAAVSKNQTDFSTYENGVIIRFAPDMTREELEQTRFLLINHDSAEHTKLRQIISRAFTPRAVGSLHEWLKDRAEKIVDEALAKESGNFVTDIAAELPLQAIAQLLGVPQEDRGKLFEWSNQMLSYDDPELGGDQMTAFMEILAYSMALADDRRRNPQDDIVTKLVSADVDGNGLTDDEFGFFMILLAVAGNETTRNAITLGMKAFIDNPDQWELYRSERPDTAVDEIIRWATPVTVFQRTAKRDLEISGQQIKEGDRVGLFYASANYDDDVFEDPFTFNVLRETNPHQAFGGHGAHYCIGANLARLEVKLIFDALADRDAKISLTSEPTKLRSGWINGVKDMPVSYR
ncbi:MULTISPECIES: cytochrome P450 [unclassified Nocardioides]|uniref:cytochrome P450 n=1 Tax=unclassified Nocardioides TaxID=2615069 RepID=UPI0007022BF6|nr:MULTISPECIES: cytochrome P450 [unclassified Nocardioides]KRA32753.1 steroid C27-monooxygenase [Nocardioides sp. Root614]KRA89405.1 steroid C27-monooxygenase [Nocardioides sp. Root682]